jgi:hypothetical protein
MWSKPRALSSGASLHGQTKHRMIQPMTSRRNAWISIQFAEMFDSESARECVLSGCRLTCDKQTTALTAFGQWYTVDFKWTDLEPLRRNHHGFQHVIYTPVFANVVSSAEDLDVVCSYKFELPTTVNVIPWQTPVSAFNGT